MEMFFRYRDKVNNDKEYTLSKFDNIKKYINNEVYNELFEKLELNLDKLYINPRKIYISVNKEDENEIDIYFIIDNNIGYLDIEILFDNDKFTINMNRMGDEDTYNEISEDLINSIIYSLNYISLLAMNNDLKIFKPRGEHIQVEIHASQL